MIPHEIQAPVIAPAPNIESICIANSENS